MTANNTAPFNVLSSAYLSRIILASLKPQPTSSSSPPPPSPSNQLTQPLDALALAANASMLAVGFRLVGLSDTVRLDTPSTAENPTPLPPTWAADKSHYSFRYRHSQSALEYLLKVMSMGSSAIIVAKAVEHDQSYSTDIKLEDFISPGNLPFSPSPSSPKESQRQSIENVFINAGRLSDLGSLLRVRIVQKLAPSLQKEGYEETSDAAATQDARRDDADGGGAAARDGQPQAPAHDPLRREDEERARPWNEDPLRADPDLPFLAREPPYRPWLEGEAGGFGRRPNPGPLVPGFDDEHDMFRGPAGGGRFAPQGVINPRIGQDDLNPFGGLRVGEPSGMYPTLDQMYDGRPRGGGGIRFDPVGPGMGGGLGGGLGGGGMGGLGGHPRGAGMGGRPPGWGGNDGFI